MASDFAASPNISIYIILAINNISIYLYDGIGIIESAANEAMNERSRAMIDVQEMSESLKLLADKSRLTILALLREREMCVCDIVEILETTQSNVSQHLKKLKTGGLINETRRRQWVYYSLNLDDKPYLHELLVQLPSMKEKISALRPQSCD